MPRIGIPSSKIAGSHWGAPGAYTLAGPPEKIKPRGFISATRAAGRSWRTSWQKTFCSRTRRAISWPYCEPKSKIRTRSLSCNGVTLLNRFRSFRLGPCGEQFFEHSVVVNPPVAAEPLDVHSAVLEEIDLPVLAGGEGQHRQGSFAVVLQPG